MPPIHGNRIQLFLVDNIAPEKVCPENLFDASPEATMHRGGESSALSRSGTTIMLAEELQGHRAQSLSTA